MAVITYTPTREVIGGSGAIAIDLSEFNRKPKSKATQFTPLAGGQGETVLAYREIIYNCTTDLVHHSQFELFKEWFASCASGETFTFDPYGNAATAGVYQFVKNSFNFQRAGGKYFIARWQMLELVAPVGGGFNVPPPAVGDYHWPLSDLPNKTYFEPGSQYYRTLQTPVALPVGSTIQITYRTNGTAFNDTFFSSSLGATNQFYVKTNPQGNELIFSGCTVEINGAPVGQLANTFYSGFVTLIATITAPTDIEFISWDGTGTNEANTHFYLFDLIVNDTADTYQWELVGNNQTDPELNFGTNSNTLSLYTVALARDYGWAKSSGVLSVEDGEPILNPSNNSLNDLDVRGPSLRDDGAGYSVNFLNTANMRRDMNIAYNQGFTIECINRIGSFQNSGSWDVGNVINAAHNLFSDNLWVMRWDDFDNGTNLRAVFTLVKRNTLYSSGNDHPANVEAEVRSTNIFPTGTNAYHFLATIRPSNNTIELWIDGVSQGIASFTNEWLWGEGGQGGVSDLLTGNKATAFSPGAGYLDGAWRAGNTYLQDIRIHLLEADENFAQKQYNGNRPLKDS